MSSPLRVAILHHHLRGGGVTRVIENTTRALAGTATRAAVLVGEEPEGACAFPVRVVAGLGYTRPGTREPAPEPVLRELIRAATDALGGEPDIWHVHNHSLGKNALTPLLVAALAAQGRRLLLQVHDFAEDGRPGNYRRLLADLAAGDAAELGRRLYPQAGNVHYALINGRDRGFLADAGVERERLHPLSNAVSLPPAPAEPGCAATDAEQARNLLAPGGERLVVYPTRAIRRKNLGEMLLWACLARARGEATRFVSTLAPRNPAARAVYDAWVRLGRNLKLPVDFAVGERVGFGAVMAAADICATFSVAEGFGLAFLEPWLLGKPLVGRDLPRITAEFRAAGVKFDALYERLLLPLQWVDAAALRARMHAALVASRDAYGLATGASELETAWNAAVPGGDKSQRVDFGRLDEEAQERAIDLLTREPERAAAILPGRLLPEPDPEVQRTNRDVISRGYDLADYGRKLRACYERVLASDTGPRPRLDAHRLLLAFNAPERFCLLRT